MFLLTLALVLAKECVPAYEYNVTDKFNVLGSRFAPDHVNNLVKMYHYSSVKEAIDIYALGMQG